MNLLDIVRGVVGAVLGIGALVTPLMLGLWVLRPVTKRPRARIPPTQFMISDILALFVVVQASVSLMFGYAGKGLRELLVLPATLVLAFWTYVWSLGVRHLSRIGLVSAWRRFVVLALLLPATLVGVMALQMVLVMLVAEGIQNLVPHGFASPASWAVMIALGMVLCGLTLRWLVATQPHEPCADGGAENPPGPFGPGREGDGMRGEG